MLITKQKGYWRIKKKMEWLRIVLVLMILTRAIYTDIKKGIIENRCMVYGLISAGLYTALYKGGTGLLQSIKMSVVMLVVLFALFVLKGLGAGDIKLFCVLAAFYQRDAIGIVVVSFLVAAGLAIVKMLIRIVRGEQFYLKGETMNFSIPIGIATIVIESMKWVKL